jgi:hypothetical protein
MNKEWLFLNESFKKFQEFFSKTTKENNYISISQNLDMMNEDIRTIEINKIFSEMKDIKDKIKEFVDDNLLYLKNLNYNFLNDSLTIFEKDEETYISKLEKRICNLFAVKYLFINIYYC